MRSKRSLRDRLFEAHARLPRSVQKHTDKAIKAGVKVNRKLSPFSQDTKRRGKAWTSNAKKKILKRFSK